jgi:hypothetical protein
MVINKEFKQNVVFILLELFYVYAFIRALRIKRSIGCMLCVKKSLNFK